MTEQELLEYIKKKRCPCILCGELKARILKDGLIAIANYDGMQCGGVEDMKHRYWEFQHQENND